MASPALLTIGELARRTGLSVSAIRFYEARGLVGAIRTGGNQRRFMRSDIRRLSFALIAQRCGLTLGEIEAEMARLPHGRAPNKADWQAISDAPPGHPGRADRDARADPRPARRLHRLRLPVAGRPAPSTIPATGPPAPARGRGSCSGTGRRISPDPSSRRRLGPQGGEGTVRVRPGSGSPAFAWAPDAWRSYTFRLSARIASSRPSSVSGYMRSCISWRTIWVDWL